MKPQDGTGQKNRIPSLGEKQSLRSLEGNPLKSAAQNITSADCTTDSGTQFRIPRKPLNTGSPVTGKPPPVTTQPIGDTQAIEKRQHSVTNPRLSKRRLCNSPILKNWWLEVGASFLFLVSLGAVIATLYPHQGKPLPKWPYHLSVNTVISIYVVVLKSTILLVTAEGLGQLKWQWLQRSRPLRDLVQYDDATRGPLGALGLLWRLRLREPLSSIGALITLLVLVVDPFTQQVIRYYDCGVSVGGVNSTIPRTNVYLQVHTNQSQPTNG